MPFTKFLVAALAAGGALGLSAIPFGAAVMCEDEFAAHAAAAIELWSIEPGNPDEISVENSG